jgi:NADPH2:quinone reductase
MRASEMARVAPDAGNMTAIPKTMRAVAIDRFGGPDVLKVHMLPIPTLDPGEVLIAVHTAGVGGWDADIRDGWWPDAVDPRFPLVLGTDGSGTVAAAGSRVRRLHVGDAVYSYSWNNPKGGFYAEYVAVAADLVAPIPTRLDLGHAGAIPTTGLTALQGIDGALHLRSVQSVLIHGASGGVGTMAVQFAKLRDARVLASASGLDGVALARRLGADEAVDGRHEDLAAAARRFAPRGLDAIFALAGGDALQRCIATVCDGGRVAYPNGVEPEPKPVGAVTLVGYDAVCSARELTKLSHAVEAAKLQVPIDSEYPLEDASKAHARLAQGHVLGKVVLRMR